MMKIDKFKIISIILGVLLIGSLLGIIDINNAGGLSKKTASEKAMNFINNQVLSPGQTANLLGVVEENGLYKLSIAINGESFDSYLTKDGKLLFPSAMEIGEVQVPVNTQTQQVQEVTSKSDKPKVELFVMTHCPYGTQAEKGLIPVIEKLGNKADINIRFVHYFMHDPEETETPIQVCIREEQSSKYLDYLECFLEDGNGDRCISEINIDKFKLKKCVSSKAEDYYAEDSALSQGYGVQGSPTLIINGQIAQSGRSSADYLSTICSAFNVEPIECNAQLSSTSHSPGFGYGASGSNTNAQC